MNILLDTHILLWWLSDDGQLSGTHREIISDTDNICYISAATIWEISIKANLKKIKISGNYIDEIKREGFLELPVSWLHCNQLKKLPAIHRDPFDRLLIAQARTEKLVLLTTDEHIKKYKVKVL